MILNIENVKLWFAKNEENNIITIDEITDSNKQNTYMCPMCGSNLIPKAVKSKQVTSHFAHVDASKCNAETMIHWWFKNKFLEQGDSFVVISDKERQYICREIMVEQSYETADQTYRPDVTVLTECGKTIFFEMDYSNKKKVQDYIDIWLELKNIVVEVDVKKLMLKDDVPSFKALFYDGKCFNIKNNDMYYNTIGKYKEEVLNNCLTENIKNRIKQLDWLWEDILKYRRGHVPIEQIIEMIKVVEKPEQQIVLDILKRTKCTDLYKWLKERIKVLEKWYFEEKIPAEKLQLIKQAVKKLNKEYKKVYKNYDIKLITETNKYLDYYWWQGRKVGRWKVSSYSYRLRLSLNEDFLKIDYIRGVIIEIDSLENIYSYLKNILEDHELYKKCLDCNSGFAISSREIKNCSDKQWSLPKRCKECRSKRRQEKILKAR